MNTAAAHASGSVAASGLEARFGRMKHRLSTDYSHLSAVRELRRESIPPPPVGHSFDVEVEWLRAALEDFTLENLAKVSPDRFALTVCAGEELAGERAFRVYVHPLVFAALYTAPVSFVPMEGNFHNFPAPELDRVVLVLPPSCRHVAYFVPPRDGLTPAQRASYSHFRSLGLSESEAFALCQEALAPKR